MHAAVFRGREGGRNERRDLVGKEKVVDVATKVGKKFMKLNTAL